MMKITNLTHYYNKDKALENINLEIKSGEFIAIIGESGSGKSTLLSILSTLLKPTSGDIVYENINYKDIKNISSLHGYVNGEISNELAFYIFITSIFMAIFGSIIPALNAAKTDPVELIQGNKI